MSRLITVSLAFAFLAAGFVVTAPVKFDPASGTLTLSAAQARDGVDADDTEVENEVGDVDGAGDND